MSPVRSSGESLPNLAMVWTLKAMLAKTKALGPVTAPSLLCRGLAADFEAGMAAQKRRYARSSAVAGPNARSLEFRVAGRRHGIEMVSMRQSDHAPLLRFLILVTAGFAENCCFVLRLPARGKSNAG